MQECGCVAYHTALATETLKGLRGRYAMVATHCDCGTSYWSFLDPSAMSGFQDVVGATRTKKCSEAELRQIVDGMIQRAADTGIGKSNIDLVLKRHGSDEKAAAGPKVTDPATKADLAGVLNCSACGESIPKMSGSNWASDGKFYDIWEGRICGSCHLVWCRKCQPPVRTCPSCKGNVNDASERYLWRQAFTKETAGATSKSKTTAGQASVSPKKKWWQFWR